MPSINQVTEIKLSDEDLPQSTGDIKIHEIGVYQVTVEIPSRMPSLSALREEAAGDRSGDDLPADQEFTVVELALKSTKFVHAARMVSTTGGRRRVTDFALCNGKRGGRPVKGRVRGKSLNYVTCPRCITHLIRAGVILAATED